MSGVYSDFPECLPRYAWLIADAAKRPAVLFHGAAGDCKACGERVGHDVKVQAAHVREHGRQLRQSAAQRQREATRRLRQVARLRSEGRRA